MCNTLVICSDSRYFATDGNKTNAAKQLLYGPNFISSDVRLHSTHGKFIIQIYAEN